MDAAESPAPVATLLENHRAFLRYLERRVGDRALAEDILQDAFAKLVARPGQAPADEGIVPWFYRTLRNAAIDQFRRRGAADRAHEAFARELETHEVPNAEMHAEICGCVSRLAATLKPEYAEALTAIEIGGTPVKTFAEQKGLSSSNAAVRVFRAREALKKRVVESCGTCAEHGCVHCTCGQRHGRVSERMFQELDDFGGMKAQGFGDDLRLAPGKEMVDGADRRSAAGHELLDTGS